MIEGSSMRFMKSIMSRSYAVIRLFTYLCRYQPLRPQSTPEHLGLWLRLTTMYVNSNSCTGIKQTVDIKYVSCGECFMAC